MEEKNITLIAMIVSIFAALFSAWQAFIAKKTLKITIEQNNFQNPNIELFIVNTSQTKDDEFIYYVIDCSILNKSRIEDSIIHASFIIQYKNPSSMIMNFKCDHNAESKNSIGINISDVAVLPIQFEAHGTCKSTFIFQIKKEILKNCSIIDYFFEISSTTGMKINRNISLIPFLEK